MTTEHQMPAVDYLVLADPPHLAGWACASCGAVYFDRRNACARCFATAFSRRPLARTGRVIAFTVVHRAAPSIRVPYTSVIVELDDGGHVKANLLGVTDPAVIVPGLRVELVTFPAGTDDSGTEAIAFGFAPAGARS
jgi:uncharacterized protein